MLTLASAMWSATRNSDIQYRDVIDYGVAASAVRNWAGYIGAAENGAADNDGGGDDKEDDGDNKAGDNGAGDNAVGDNAVGDTVAAENKAPNNRAANDGLLYCYIQYSEVAGVKRIHCGCNTCMPLLRFLRLLRLMLV